MKNSRKPLIIVSMALLLAVVLAMSCVTFARYVSDTGTKSNSAKVATWGWEIAADASGLFGPKYAAGTDNLSVTSDEGTVVVAATADPQHNVVAPGTTGSMTFSINGKAEVLSQLTVTVSGNGVYLGTAEAITYEPVKWTLKKGATADSITEEVFANKSFSEMETALEAFSQKVQANSEADCDGYYELSWAWAFGESDSATDETNVNDTKLGAIIAGTQTGDAQTSMVINIGIKVEQVQA